jgi:hypothetical protein
VSGKRRAKKAAARPRALPLAKSLARYGAPPRRYSRRPEYERSAGTALAPAREAGHSCGALDGGALWPRELNQLSGDPPGRLPPTRGQSARREALAPAGGEGGHEVVVRTLLAEGGGARPRGVGGERSRSEREGAQPPGSAGGAPRDSAGSPAVQGPPALASRREAVAPAGGEGGHEVVARTPLAEGGGARPPLASASRASALAECRARIHTFRREPGHVRRSRSAPPRCSRLDRMRTPHRGSSLSTASGRVPGPRGSRS